MAGTRKIILFLVFNSFHLVLIFPRTDYTFQRLTVEDGLHNSIVYSIVQDKDDVVWFALRDGINRFNGYDFSFYNHCAASDGSLEQFLQVNALLMDRSKTIWAGSDLGLLMFDYRRDLFIKVRDDFKERFSINQINTLAIDGSDRIWCGTNEGVIIHDPKADSTSKIPSFYWNSLAIHFSEGEKAWIGTDHGLYLYDIEAGDFADLPVDAEHQRFLREVDVFSFCELDKGRLLVGTRENGMILLDPDAGTLKRIPLFHQGRPRVIRDILKYGEGNILVGTDGGGLYILDGALEIRTRFILDEDEPRTLSNNGIYDLFIDSQDRIWISTYGGGVNMYDPNAKPFEVIRHDLNNPMSLRNNTARSVLEDSRGKLWFGTKDGVSIMDRDGNKCRHLVHGSGSSDDLSSDVVLSLLRDRQNRIWVSTFSGGIDIYGPDLKKIAHMAN